MVVAVVVVALFCVLDEFFAFVLLGVVSLLLAKRLAGKNVSNMACFV